MRFPRGHRLRPMLNYIEGAAQAKKTKS